MNQSYKNIGDLYISDEELSAEDFINLTMEERSNIERVEIVTPRFGSHGFGKFRVLYRIPQLKRQHGRQQPQPA